MLIKILVF